MRIYRWLAIIGIVILLSYLSGCGLFSKSITDSKVGKKEQLTPPPKTAKEAVDLKDRAETQDMLRTVIVICVILFGVSGALALIFKPKFGIAGMVASFLTISAAITVGRSIDIIKYVTLGVAGLVLAYFIWQAWLNRKALVQDVTKNEVVKPSLPYVNKKYIYGDKGKGVSGLIQDKSTEKIIEKIRKGLDIKIDEGPMNPPSEIVT